jgi:hypothetical protein
LVFGPLLSVALNNSFLTVRALAPPAELTFAATRAAVATQNGHINSS